MEVTNLTGTEQEIHASVKVKSSNLYWLFTAVYASPRFRERRLLWNNLKYVSSIHNLPWIIASDFNELLSSEEKFGGRPMSLYRANLFKECLDSCNMADLGFQGPRFTWTNKQDITTLIQGRLDRFFANPDWCVMYPEAQITHLTRCSSDHCLVLLELQPQSNFRLPRPFRFQSFWLLDQTFPTVVRNAWSRNENLFEATSKFSRDVADWNHTHFGNIFAKKRRTVARLNGVQKAMVTRPNTFLITLERKLLLELALVNSQEEELWALKSRINWMIQGYRNTTFYHMSTLIRRKHNKILNLKDNQGEWITNIHAVMEFVRSSCITLFSTDLVVAPREVPPSEYICPQISETEAQVLNLPIHTNEIKHALWSLKASKAPGPDGLHAGFYQRFWLIVG